MVVGVPLTTEDTALEAAEAPLLTALLAPLAALPATLLAALAPLLATLLAALAPLLALLLAALAPLLTALPAALAADEPMLEALDIASLVASLVAEQLTANAAAMARPPKLVRPDLGRMSLYQKRFQLWSALATSLSPHWQALKELACE